MRSGPSLEIVLDKPELLVRGSFDEATPALLSGKLVVHLHESIRVRSLKMVFTGRVDLFLNQGLVGSNVSKDEHRNILTHEWQFLEPQKPSILWGPEDKEFRFDLLVQGDNPETILTALGKIRYQLQATLERTSFHVNLVTAIDVPLKRGPMPGAPWALALMESIEAAGEWDQQLDYRVSVPTRSLKDGELFHTRFELEPRVKGMKLVAVGVLVKEYIRYYSSTGQPLHKFSRVVARNENYLDRNGTCSTAPRKADECLDMMDATSVQIPLAVPEAYGGTQYDVITDLIEIRHRIKFLIKIRDPFMLVHSIFIAVPVSIMPVTARDDTSILPLYETALLNPGTVIMRSGTQPPAYDAISQASGMQETGNDVSAAAPVSPAGSSRVARPPSGNSPEYLAVEPGTVVNGFPGPLHRTGSQFYLASPDSSPSMRPIDSAARGSLNDGPRNSIHQNSASSSTAVTAIDDGDDVVAGGIRQSSRSASASRSTAALSPSGGSDTDLTVPVLASSPGQMGATRELLPQALPAEYERNPSFGMQKIGGDPCSDSSNATLTSSSLPTHGSILDITEAVPQQAHGGPDAGADSTATAPSATANGIKRPQSRASLSSNKSTSLHDRLAGSKISEKMRSIFHSRTSSNATADDPASHANGSMTPPPMGTIPIVDCDATAGRGSVSAVAPPMPVHVAPTRHRNTNSLSLLGGLGQLHLQSRRSSLGNVNPPDSSPSRGHATPSSPLVLQ
ncbi:hypothetical protein GQ54DRAFT_298850 [Martensiomyces pterosporus]|nr:hypothetical protein GQ54DRAFT_298850 [Martensiomyces pterosporus]